MGGIGLLTEFEKGKGVTNYVITKVRWRRSRPTVMVLRVSLKKVGRSRCGVEGEKD